MDTVKKIDDMLLEFSLFGKSKKSGFWLNWKERIDVAKKKTELTIIMKRMERSFKMKQITKDEYNDLANRVSQRWEGII